MATEAQIEANRRNAQKSTGPRTPEGKARAAQNSRKHGFTSSAFAVVRLEDMQETADLRADLIAVYQPVNAQETYAIERIAITQLNLLRSARLDAGFFIASLGEALDPLNAERIIGINEELTFDIDVTPAQKRNHAVVQGVHRLGQSANTWSLCMRYHALAERHYRRAIEDFERLKALRAELQNEPNFDPQLPLTETISPRFPVNPIALPEPNPKDSIPDRQ